MVTDEINGDGANLVAQRPLGVRARANRASWSSTSTFSVSTASWRSMAQMPQLSV